MPDLFLPQLAGRSLTLSLGIRRLATFPALFPESAGLSYGYIGAGAFDQVIGWGRKPNTGRARALAEARNLPYFALEDGFLRSLRPGTGGGTPLSLVLDDLGIYYDASGPSRLETLLRSDGWQTPDLLHRARHLLRKIRKHQVSKYNHAPELVGVLPGDGDSKVLVIDQTYGDNSVVLGCADEASFQRMLRDAIAENPTADVFIKTHPEVIAGKKRGYFSLEEVKSLGVRVLAEDVNPISLLEQVDRVYVVTSQLGFEALLCEKPVKCYGLPFYAGWGLTEDTQQCARRGVERTLEELFAAAYILYPRYLNPETGRAGEIEDVVEHFIRCRGIGDRIPGTRIVCGNFLWWKRRFIRTLLASFGYRLSFSDVPESAAGADAILVWGGRTKLASVGFDRGSEAPVVSMEDGFLRSVGLGSDLAPPMSLVLDRRGIYFDPRRPSDLEVLLQRGEFDTDELRRAAALREQLLAGRIGKYSVGDEAPPELPGSSAKRVLLVPGQVEDDASIEVGCVDIRTNLELLREVRKSHPEAYVIFKPHPDVASGNRIGEVPEDVARRYCNHFVVGSSAAACLGVCDEVHTLTSLTGFEALLHGKTVVTYGIPFYAGWGLTDDRHRCERRTRALSLEELIAGTLIRYPLYVDPTTKRLISVEKAVGILGRVKSERSPEITSRPLRKIVRNIKGFLQWNLP